MSGNPDHSIVNLPAATHNSLFRDLSFNDLFNYSKVSSAAYTAVQKFYRRALRIENILLPYFSLEDINRFRILQYAYGILISGSAALSFFERQTYPESDLDLYVNVKYCSILADFLVGAGYEFLPHISENKQQPFRLQRAIEEAIERFEEPVVDPPLGMQTPRYSIAGILDVFTFVRDDGKKVEVIVCESSPMKVILGYHSTVVMNVIGYSHAISLYPKSTFRNRVTLRNGRRRQQEAKAIRARKKYEDRGWETITSVDAIAALAYNSDLNMFTRYPGDKYCWTVELPPVDNFVESEPGLGRAEYLKAHSWRLNYVNWTETRTVLKVFSQPQLKQEYCLAPEVLEELKEYPMFEEVSEQEDQEQANEQPHLDTELQDVVSELYHRSQQDKVNDYIRNKLLAAFTDMSHRYASGLLPSACVVQALYHHLLDVFATLQRKPTLKIWFGQSSSGIIWTNVAVVMPLTRGRNVATLRINDDVLQTLQSYKVNLDVVRR
ncbi:hypothetical protein Moror_8699 [Moniliophthora roreri MCA 2997]|uniref:F-box domain-containing protein n=2 Tax=Moniliophthora roreri TaxID=221103 RepID=V2X9T6_MONRO|nr:hypothetical protein Moror_8699 [Moniliophthora roreri MCA 2997]KAI3602191.1 hypothetical protein WG66_002510 [Moniliophthora roreri]